MDTGGLGRGVIFCFVLLGVFAAILAFMPSQYLYVGNKPEYEERTYPSYWSPSDIQTIRWHANMSLNATEWYGYAEIERIGTDWEDTIYVKGHWDVGLQTFEFYHWNWGWSFFGWSTGSCHINPYSITESQILDSNHLDPDGNSSRFAMYCDHHDFVVHFIFDNATYSNLTDALSNHEVVVDFGMGWDYERGALSGWDLISRLLFFQAIPQLGDPLLTILISLPIWGAIAFIIFIIVTKIAEMLPFT